MTYTVTGQLEVDPVRGVIYLHRAEGGLSALRIQGLPPMDPERVKRALNVDGQMLDIKVKDAIVF